MEKLGNFRHSDSGFIGEESAFRRQRNNRFLVLPRFGMTILLGDTIFDQGFLPWDAVAGSNRESLIPWL